MRLFLIIILILSSSFAMGMTRVITVKNVRSINFENLESELQNVCGEANLIDWSITKRPSQVTIDVVLDGRLQNIHIGEGTYRFPATELETSKDYIDFLLKGSVTLDPHDVYVHLKHYCYFRGNYVRDFYLTEPYQLIWELESHNESDGYDQAVVQIEELQREVTNRKEDLDGESRKFSQLKKEKDDLQAKFDGYRADKETMDYMYGRGKYAHHTYDLAKRWGARLPVRMSNKDEDE